MVKDGHEIRFDAEVIRFDGPGGWHGLFLPEEATAAARFFGHANALGAIAVELHIGESKIKTSLFPDKMRSSFLLPLKAEVRRRENVSEGDRITVTLLLRD